MIPVKPNIIPMPFAQNGDRSTIPEEIVSSGAANASWDVGFPAITRISKNAGGKPPLGMDFQSIFYSLSSHLFWMQSGGIYSWNNKLNYLAGSHVLGSDGKEYRCIAPNGPDVPGATGYVGAIDPTSDNNGYWSDDPVAITTPFVGATAGASGQEGIVPKPLSGQQNRYLKADGTWALPPDTTYTAGSGLTLSGTIFSLSTSGVSAGNYGPTQALSPAAGDTIPVPEIAVDQYGRITGIVARPVTLPSGSATATTAISANEDSLSQNISATYIKGISVDGNNLVLTKGNGNATTISLGTSNSPFTGATASVAGTSGLVPAPAAGKESAYLRGDGTWVELSLDGVTLQNASTSNAGIVQLYDGVDSTSDSLAATANSVKTAYDLANSASTAATNAYTIAERAEQSASNVSTNYMPLTGGTFTGGVFETAVNMTGTQINLTLGSVFKKTISDTTTFSITGSGPAASFSLILTNGGAYTVTWPNSVVWANGNPPSLSSSGTDLLTFLTGDNGTTWYGVMSVKNAL